ncbi:PrsW family intramembrane metalloprotease [Candidatus Parcubacteria bacterium]|nr:PrsW family intramembrane metalloprotease [Candidatus Parcubacteria bacterium]
MNGFSLLICALAPGIIWLLYFLRKDVHPESNRMILRIFFYGMLITFPAVLLEKGFFEITKVLNFSSTSTLILNFFIGVALVEEGLKYLVVKKKVLNNSEFDEPVDAMLYMIIAALGFATVENILILFSPEMFFQPLAGVLGVTALRFVGATFLHALCSGMIGYFLALSFCEPKNTFKYLIRKLGLGIAVFLHGLYNFSIIAIEGSLKFNLPLIILIFLSVFVFFAFKKANKMESVCEISE